jgi:hypothetical protein
LIGACYKGKKPHFEISVKLWIFIPILTYLKKKILTLFSEFFSLLGQKLISGQEDMKIKKNLLCYFGLRILLSIQIQLLDTENLKNPKIDSTYSTVH